MGHTLVIHPGALGDVVLAVPALRALRRAQPQHELVLASQSHLGDLLHGLRIVDAGVRFDRLGLHALFAGAPLDAPLRVVADAERVVCWFGSTDPGFAGRLREIAPRAIVAASASPGRPVWQHLVSTVTDPSGTEVTDTMPVVVPRALVDEGGRALEAAGWNRRQRLVLVHPGASGPRKRWATDAFARVIDTLAQDVTVVLHEGPADGDAVAALRERVGRPIVHFDNPTLPVLAGACAHVAAYLGNDSGVSHVAAAVGVPSVIVFATDTLAWRPWSPTAEAVVVAVASAAESDVRVVARALERRLG